MQELDLTLEIPVGMVVFLDHSLEDLIYDIKNVKICGIMICLATIGKWKKKVLVVLVVNNKKDIFFE